MMESVRSDLKAFWQAGIRSVSPASIAARFSRHAVSGELRYDNVSIDPAVIVQNVEKIVVVGGGKAAAGMAAGIENMLGRQAIHEHCLQGLVSVPIGSGIQLSAIEVRETRPAAANLPTDASVAATHEMLVLLDSLGPKDLAIALISGGGSALMTMPREGVSLDEKVALTRFLSEAGADIDALNAVRQAASLVKAGGLARACRAGRLVVFVLSDIIGGTLDIIASGPCLPVPPRPKEVLAILERYGALRAGIAPRLIERFVVDAASECDSTIFYSPLGNWTTPRGCVVSHTLVGSNATAVQQAAMTARQRGYQVCRAGDQRPLSEATESAESVGARLAIEAVSLFAAAKQDGQPRAIIEGGESTVVVPAAHGKGGRNQQTVLAAIDAFQRSGTAWPVGLVIASIGTDGEDGPTDAAGACVDCDVVAALGEQGLDIAGAMDRCDAYPLLAAGGGLVHTGSTGTNVADLRIVLARANDAGKSSSKK